MYKNKEWECKETILALDPATNTGYALYKNGKIIKSGVWQLGREGKKYDLRYEKLYDHLNSMIEKYNVTMIVAEDIFKDNLKPTAFEVLSGYQGIILLAASQNMIPIPSFYSPISVKSYMFGYNYSKCVKTRKEGKDAMIRVVKHKGYELHTSDPKLVDNEADAIGVLLTAMYRKNFIAPNPITKID